MATGLGAALVDACGWTSGASELETDGAGADDVRRAADGPTLGDNEAGNDDAAVDDAGNDDAAALEGTAEVVELAAWVSLSGIDDPASATGLSETSVTVPDVAAVPITATRTTQPPTAAAAATVDTIRPTRMWPV